MSDDIAKNLQQEYQELYFTAEHLVRRDITLLYRFRPFIEEINCITNPETLFKFVKKFEQYGVKHRNGYANGRKFYLPKDIPEKFIISPDRKCLLRRPTLKVRMVTGEVFKIYYNSVEELEKDSIELTKGLNQL